MRQNLVLILISLSSFTLALPDITDDPVGRSRMALLFIQNTFIKMQGLKLYTDPDTSEDLYNQLKGLETIIPYIAAQGYAYAF